MPQQKYYSLLHLIVAVHFFYKSGAAFLEKILFGRYALQYSWMRNQMTRHSISRLPQQHILLPWQQLTNDLHHVETNPYNFMLEILFRISLFFWYIKILVRPFSFWDIENVKPKSQPRYAYKLYAYKKSVWNVKKGNWLLQKLILRHFYQIYFQICPRFVRIISPKPCFSSQK